MQWSGLLTKWLQSSVTLKCCMCTLVAVGMRGVEATGLDKDGNQLTVVILQRLPCVPGPPYSLFVLTNREGPSWTPPTWPTLTTAPSRGGSSPTSTGQPNTHVRWISLFHFASPHSFLPPTLLFFSPFSAVSSCCPGGFGEYKGRYHVHVSPFMFCISVLHPPPPPPLHFKKSRSKIHFFWFPRSITCSF